MSSVYWADGYQIKRISIQEAIRCIRPGQRVFIGSSAGEPQALVKELALQCHRFADLEIVRLLSQETSPLTRIAHTSQGDCFSLRSFYQGSAQIQDLGGPTRFITPINLSALPRLFNTGQLPIQVALIQVSPPDDSGWMSLGVSVDVTLAAAQSADLVIAQVNPRMPRVRGNSFIHVTNVDWVVEWAEELITMDRPPEYESARMIARLVARLIDDGSTLQLDPGILSQAILLALKDKKDLGIHSRFLTEAMMDLVGWGVITNRKKGLNEGKSVASAAIGTRNLYEFLNDNPCVEFYPSDYVNNPAVISKHHKMVALNEAVAIDLTGQVAADALPCTHFTGLSGMLDFMRGAVDSEGGKAVLMLPSTTLDGGKSRIVPRLVDAAVVVPRADVHYVATEYGLVNLFGKSLQERAMALIGIAHPSFREDLFSRAKELELLGPERNPADSAVGICPLKFEEFREMGGYRFCFRPAGPADERIIQEHFYNMDKEDVLSRFLHEKILFPRKDIAPMVQADYIQKMPILAVIGELGFEKVIGIGAYFLEPSKNTAEIAFSVLKKWQKKGIGSVLIKMLTQTALENRISGLTAYAQPRNQGMIRLMHKLPYPVKTSLEEELLVLSCRFDEPKNEGHWSDG
jgi:acyl-CoA hydrolase/GNAT superfamily N-acetyltransferase